MLRCNVQFHADSAFNPRRAGYSLLLAHQLPPPGTGGNTEFADSRTAYDDLPDEVKERIKDYVLENSQFQCRRSANPGNPMVSGEDVRIPAVQGAILANNQFDPMNNRRGLHKLVQLHEPSGRTNMYITAHAHHVAGKPVKEGRAEVSDLLEWAGQEKYVLDLSKRYFEVKIRLGRVDHVQIPSGGRMETTGRSR